MASINVDKMTLKELVELEVRVKKAITGARVREQADIKAQFDELARSAGTSVAELYGFGAKRGARKGSKVAPKYVNPDDDSETWTGRGRQPRWLTAKLAKGGKVADYTI